MLSIIETSRHFFLYFKIYKKVKFLHLGKYEFKLQL
ncbi:Uncharacterised protein [Mycobacteroides abscessus subsp. abscessus]|nr:Uncharacterised protein [Mycobacteroides abscessus subsp. abscessus]